MSKYKASSFIKTGTCLRYLIDVQEGSAVGKARPDPGQSNTDRVNSRMEKIHEDANVLANMQKVDGLIKEIGFEDVRKGEREHLQNVLIPAALSVRNADDGRGRLTAELVKQISDNARDIRKGLIEAADKVDLYDEPDNSENWPSQFRTELLWHIPWWLILAFVTTALLAISFTETPAYDDIKKWMTPKEHVAKEVGTEGGEKDKSNQMEQEQEQERKKNA